MVYNAGLWATGIRGVGGVLQAGEGSARGDRATVVCQSILPIFPSHRKVTRWVSDVGAHITTHSIVLPLSEEIQKSKRKNNPTNPTFPQRAIHSLPPPLPRLPLPDTLLPRLALLQTRRPGRRHRSSPSLGNGPSAAPAYDLGRLEEPHDAEDDGVSNAERRPVQGQGKEEG